MTCLDPHPPRPATAQPSDYTAPPMAKLRPQSSVHKTGNASYDATRLTAVAGDGSDVHVVRTSQSAASTKATTESVVPRRVVSQPQTLPTSVKQVDGQGVGASLSQVSFADGVVSRPSSAASGGVTHDVASPTVSRRVSRDITIDVPVLPGGRDSLIIQQSSLDELMTVNDE